MSVLFEDIFDVKVSYERMFSKLEKLDSRSDTDLLLFKFMGFFVNIVVLPNGIAWRKHFLKQSNFG